MTFKQGDPRWGTKRLGNSPFFMADSGCYVTAIAQMLVDVFGKDTDPGRLCDELNKIGAFDSLGQLMAWYITKIYPDIKLDVYEDTDLDKNPSKNEIPTALALQEIQKAEAKGAGIILRVDLSPKDGKNQGDHAIKYTAWNAGNPQIKDPWYGTDTTLSSPTPDLPNGYGSPEKAIYGYRIFINTMTEHLNLPDKKLVKKGDGNGELAYYKGGKLLRGSQIDIISQYLAEKEGIFISTKDFDKFPLGDIKKP